MSKRDLDFEFTATDDQAGGKALLSGIPAPLWTRFVSRAQGLMPEKGAAAWSAILAEVIASVGGGGQTYTLILTDIPNAAREALDATTQAVASSSERMIAQFYQHAEAGRLHLLRIQELDAQPTRMLLVSGIPQVAWDAWAQVAEKVDEQPETLFGMLLQAAANGTLRTNKQVDYASTATNGDREGLRGSPEHAAPSAEPG